MERREGCSNQWTPLNLEQADAALRARATAPALPTAPTAFVATSVAPTAPLTPTVVAGASSSAAPGVAGLPVPFPVVVADNGQNGSHAQVWQRHNRHCAPLPHSE